MAHDVDDEEVEVDDSSNSSDQSDASDASDRKDTKDKKHNKDKKHKKEKKEKKEKKSKKHKSGKDKKDKSHTKEKKSKKDKKDKKHKKAKSRGPRGSQRVKWESPFQPGSNMSKLFALASAKKGVRHKDFHKAAKKLGAKESWALSILRREERLGTWTWSFDDADNRYRITGIKKHKSK